MNPKRADQPNPRRFLTGFPVFTAAQVKDDRAGFRQRGAVRRTTLFQTPIVILKEGT